MSRVALVTSQFDHVNTGAGTFAHYLCSGNHHALELTFFSEDIEAPATHKRRISCPPWVKHVPGALFFEMPIYHRAFLAAHREHSFDLLWYGASPTRGFLSARQQIDVPVVLMIHDAKYIMSRIPFASRSILGLKRSLTYSVKRLFEKRALHYCDAAVVNSRFMERQVHQQYGVPAEKLHVLHQAVDVQGFAFHPPEPISGAMRVLFLKTDHRVGGLEDLVEALSMLPFETHLTVAGPPLDRASAITAMRQRHRYEGMMDIRGRVPRERVPALFREHDVLCVPSLTEALGVVFLEALASGIPAVGSKVGGIPEVLAGGRAGWLAEPGNAADLRRMLATVVNNPKQRLQKVHYGRRFVAENFSAEVMMQRFEEIANDVLAKTRR